MFLYSFRLTKKRIFAFLAALVMVVGAITMSVRALGDDGGEVEANASAPVSETVPEETAKPKKVTVKTNEDRVAFVEGFGWTVEAEPAEVLEVIIPEEFDQVYQDYNAMQKVQGYDLEKYAGKRCKRYSYTITNYPGGEDEVRINVLVYKNKVVGGDVCSTAQDGFIHGFAAQPQ